MMSIGQLARDQESYYLIEVIEGREDYYLDAGEAPGRWAGRLAAELGLAGYGDSDALHIVLAGADPRNSEALRSSIATVPGFDLTLSPPKGVSLCWALADRFEAELIVAAHDSGVDAALTYLERHACWLRRGHAGAEFVPGGGFVVPAFHHRTSRAGDPQLHTRSSCCAVAAAITTMGTS
jgi:conjugative relaxase-like TrwC/TraI family protein